MPGQPYPGGGSPATQDPSGERPLPTAEDDSGLIAVKTTDIPPGMGKAPHPDMTQTFPVTINGRSETWTLEQIITAAQKVAAADEKFRTAADQTKDNARAIAMAEDIQAVFEGDTDAFRRLGATMGMKGDAVEQIVSQTFGKEEGDDGDDGEDPLEQYGKESRRASSPSRKEGPIGYDALTPDVQRLLVEGEKARIDKIVQKALDKDEGLRYNVERLSPQGQEAIRRLVDDKIRGRLDSVGGDFGDGTRILSEILPEVKTHLEALGTPGQRTPTGLGQAPGGGDTEVYPTKMPDHVSSTDGDEFEKNILETLAYNQAQADRGSHQ